MEDTTVRQNITIHQSTQCNAPEDLITKEVLFPLRILYALVTWKRNSCFEGLYECTHPLLPSLCIQHFLSQIYVINLCISAHAKY
jgi:hypothetical protein